MRTLLVFLLCLYPAACQKSEQKTTISDKDPKVQPTGATPVDAAHGDRTPLLDEPTKAGVPDGKIWLPSTASVTRGDEKYFLGIKPADLGLFIEKNGLKPLVEWPQMATTCHRGYLPPDELAKLHENDPLISGTVVTTMPGDSGYIAIYYNRDFDYLVIQGP